MILGNQKSFGDKRGIGYINDVPSTSTTKFVKEKVLNKTPSFRKYVVQHNQGLYRKTSLTCHYCNKKGHHVKLCFYKKNAHRLNLNWIPKINNDMIANIDGPKKTWVPKVPM